MALRYYNIFSVKEWARMIVDGGKGVARLLVRELESAALHEGDALDKNVQILVFYNTNIKGDTREFLERFSGSLRLMNDQDIFNITYNLLAQVTSLNIDRRSEKILRDMLERIYVLYPSWRGTITPQILFPDMVVPIHHGRVRVDSENVRVLDPQRKEIHIASGIHRFEIGERQDFSQTRVGRAMRAQGVELRQTLLSFSYVFMEALALKGPMLAVAKGYFGGSIRHRYGDFVRNQIRFCSDVVEDALEKELEHRVGLNLRPEELRLSLHEIFWTGHLRDGIQDTFQKALEYELGEDIAEETQTVEDLERLGHKKALIPMLYEAAMEILYVFGGSPQCSEIIEQCVQDYAATFSEEKRAGGVDDNPKPKKRSTQ